MTVTADEFIRRFLQHVLPMTFLGFVPAGPDSVIIHDSSETKPTRTTSNHPTRVLATCGKLVFRDFPSVGRGGSAPSAKIAPFRRISPSVQQPDPAQLALPRHPAIRLEHARRPFHARQNSPESAHGDAKPYSQPLFKSRPSYPLSARAT
jgi:hypothetical protein